MNVTNIRKGLFFTAAVAMLAMGCELVVDFDRTKIPVDDAGATVDATATDAAVIDSSPTADTGTDSAVATDTGTDSAIADAGTDSATSADANDE